jgi:hypothetical protein
MLSPQARLATGEAMKVPQISKKVSGHVVVDSADISTALEPEWLLAAGNVDLTIWHEQRGLQGSGTFTSKARYRYAKVDPTKPEDWQNATTARTAEDQFVEVVDISANTT